MARIRMGVLASKVVFSVIFAILCVLGFISTVSNAELLNCLGAMGFGAVAIVLALSARKQYRRETAAAAE